MTNKDKQFEMMKQESKEMKDLFLPYELAFLAKKVGFNYPCFAFYWDKSWKDKISDTFHYTVGYKNHNELQSRVSAPLYDQILDWFEKERNDILDDAVYFSFLEQKWAIAENVHPFRYDDLLCTYYASKRDALNYLIKDHLEAALEI